MIRESQQHILQPIYSQSNNYWSQIDCNQIHVLLYFFGKTTKTWHERCLRPQLSPHNTNTKQSSAVIILLLKPTWIDPSAWHSKPRLNHQCQYRGRNCQPVGWGTKVQYESNLKVLSHQIWLGTACCIVPTNLVWKRQCMVPYRNVRVMPDPLWMNCWA